MTDWPRLSEDLTGPKDPEHCQSCGSTANLSVWQEHSAADRPENVFVVLCELCSRTLVEPHPRLYRQLDRNEPRPGVMALCARCRHRDGTRCQHPDAMTNGGTGLAISHSKPMTAFVDGTFGGRRGGRQVTMYANPPSACAGRAVQDKSHAR